jgi:hypothetical protein
MGARGLDSNKELEFYIQAATDPARDIQANRAALQVLENAYGLSSRVKGVSKAQIDALGAEFKGAAESAPAPEAPAAAPQYREGQTATGPGGQKIIFKGGQWQPLSP